MGNLPIHIYGYNNEHDVIVYTVIKDTQSEFEQPHHPFQKSQFWSIYTKTQPRSKKNKKTIGVYSIFESLCFRGPNTLE